MEKADHVIGSFLDTRPSSRYEKLAQTLRDSFESNPPVVHIGVVQPITGMFGPEADQFLKGLAMALRDNRKVRDKIKFVLKDSQGSPIHTVESAKQLTRLEPLSLMIGELEFGNSAITAGFASTTDIPLIIPIATGTSELAGMGERVFQANQDLETRGRALAEYAYNHLNFHTFAALAPADDYGHSITDAFLKHVDELGGQVISQQWYYPGTEDFKRQLQTIRRAAFRNAFRDSIRAMNIPVTQQRIDSLFAAQSDLSKKESEDEEGLIENDNIAAGAIDGFFLPIYKEDIPFVLSQMALFNIKARPLGGTYWNNLDVLRSQKRYAEGAVFTTGLTMLDTDPEYRKFINDFRRATSQSPTQAALYGYNIMTLIIHAVEQGYTTRDAILSYLENTRNFDVIGGEITFDTDHVNQAVNILEFRQGNIVSVK
ncbi:MAG: ABC transporter substrate-binding protein [candidate division KSB1 bacterium]|nr:ABC transporter substrate-binding protein [candidate division KSB1 bacterium]